MKRLLTLCCLALACQGVFSQTTPRWLRQSCISADGKTIAFAWQGDIWTVPASGGQASRITANPAYDNDPLWTPDGREIVFSSYREGSKDVWAVAAAGGEPRRLTTWVGAEQPLAISPQGEVYFAAAIQDEPAYAGFPGMPQLYKVGLSGGKPRLVTSIPVGAASVNADGAILYEDRKGYEDPLRKHHTSSVTRDIWLFQPADGSFRQLSTFRGEDRNPVFCADGRHYYYLSEAETDCFNVWKADLLDGRAERLTDLRTHPVRYLSVAADGTCLFSWNGDLYRTAGGDAPQKVAISLAKDAQQRVETRMEAATISDFAASPGGKEIAVISRGNVFACATDAGITRQITDTDAQERGLDFSKDGRTLYYASERDGEWGIWKSELQNKEDKYFCLSCSFREERVTPRGQTCFQPQVSPDGKWLAYLRDRTEIVIRSTKGGEERSLLKGVNYSYTDGDLSFEWSPDSRYILCDYQADGGWNNADVALIDIHDGQITNLTESGYSDGNFRWAMGGKAMTWTSDKAGFRSHGSWGAERDVYMMFFDAKTYARFIRSKNEADIDKLLEADKKDGEKKKEGADSVKVEKKRFTPDLENREDRIVRLTPSAGHMGDYILSGDGSKLYYVMRLEKGADLCCLDTRTKSVKVLKKGFRGSFMPAADGQSAFVVSSRSVSRLNFKNDTFTEIAFKGKFFHSPARERTYIFEHCWKQVDEKFYDRDIHGVDWKAMHDNYVQFLPEIDNNHDFQELLSEMLGELNGSHTGARYRFSPEGAPTTGYLGVIYDPDYRGKGLRIAEILPGSVLAAAAPDTRAGDVILAVNGKEIGEDACWWEALRYTAGERTRLTLRRHGSQTEVCLIPASSDYPGLYTRWVRRQEAAVEKLSGGKVGYVHVQGMNSASFREVYSKALGKYRKCAALIVDTRHNGGGWLHDDLATFLNGKPYLEFRPRGQYIGTEPYSKWNKPSCVLMGEDNYSDACGFPYVYKTLGIGKLIGAPVPGTMTAVWWETQIDPTLVFGIPQVTSWGLRENRPLENLQIEPDIAVQNDPASLLRGEDRQLEAAVKEMLP
ncbi:MAG: PD40 domain-containing protein [Bacteroidales bacterium]|nr:PD40 domain-containing protein [Bacteroidales bacterium]